MSPLTEALIECVKAVPGGSKAVGPALWPEKDPGAAQRLLLDCLNDDRPQKLAPEQVVLVARLARERGCHAYARYLADALSYAEPVPVEPKDIADDLQRQAIEMGRQLTEMLARLEKVRGGGT
jgi:hypothetical protein